MMKTGLNLGGLDSRSKEKYIITRITLKKIEKNFF